jgi:hypothetical protein
MVRTKFPPAKGSDQEEGWRALRVQVSALLMRDPVYREQVKVLQASLERERLEREN